MNQATIDHIAERLNQWLSRPSRSQRTHVSALFGAGISVAAGTSDFRTPVTGMFSTLRPELLTATEEERDMMRLEPKSVLSARLFHKNQLACLELLRPLILGMAEQRPMVPLAHRFFQILHQKGTIQSAIPLHFIAFL